MIYGQAQKLADSLHHYQSGHSARVWEGDDRVRVYVTRQLSRRRQEVGYIELTEEGVTYALERNRAGIIRHVESVLSS